MKKQHYILSFALSLFLFSVVLSNNAQAQKLKSEVTVSRTVSAGQTAADGRPMVVVTITIKKDAFKGPARIEENFSSDFQAVLISSDRASFQNSNGKAQFIWNELQEDRVVTVSYALEALGKTSDNQTISGKFYYQNTAFDIAASSFTIDASNLKPYVASAPSDMSTLDELYHDVTGDYPDGVSAPATTSSTSVSSGMASSPGNTNQPMQHQAAVTTPTQQVPVATTTPTITSTPVQQQTTANTTSTTNNTSTQQQTAATTTSTAASAPAVQQQTTANTTSTANSTSTQQQTAETTPAQQTSTENTASAPVASSGNDNSGGVIYRIQVVVVGDKARVPSFLRQYKITEQPVYESVTTGDTPARVMVGSYSDYNSAKARCEQLRSRGIKDAFIAPYYMGKRITIAEAASHTQH